MRPRLFGISLQIHTNIHPSVWTWVGDAVNESSEWRSTLTTSSLGVMRLENSVYYICCCNRIYGITQLYINRYTNFVLCKQFPQQNLIYHTYVGIYLSKKYCVEALRLNRWQYCLLLMACALSKIWTLYNYKQIFWWVN